MNWMVACGVQLGHFAFHNFLSCLRGRKKTIRPHQQVSNEAVWNRVRSAFPWDMVFHTGESQKHVFFGVELKSRKGTEKVNNPRFKSRKLLPTQTSEVSQETHENWKNGSAAGRECGEERISFQEFPQFSLTHTRVCVCVRVHAEGSCVLVFHQRQMIRQDKEMEIIENCFPVRQRRKNPDVWWMNRRKCAEFGLKKKR